MNTYVIVRRKQWSSKRELEAAVVRSIEAAEVLGADFALVRSYVLAEEDGSLGAICVYKATSEDLVREHDVCADMVADEIALVEDLIVVGPDG